MPESVRRRALANGIRRIFPLSLASLPFGLVYGATAAENGIPHGPAILASFVILAGAAQIALVELIAEGATAAVAVGTALIINLRMALYSASLAPAFRDFPARWRFPLAHLTTDQSAVTSLMEWENETDPVYRRWFWIGASLWFASPWWIGTAIGVLVGGDIPEGWQIGFAVPLMFTALLVPTLRDRPTVVAGIVGAAVTVGTTWLPDGVNIMLGAIFGIAAGTWAAETKASGAEEAT